MVLSKLWDLKELSSLVITGGQSAASIVFDSVQLRAFNCVGSEQTLCLLSKLATAQGLVTAADAGTAGAKEQRKARRVEALPDEGLGTSSGTCQSGNGARRRPKYQH